MDILLVDDNEDYLFLVKEVLCQSGYTVHDLLKLVDELIFGRVDGAWN